MSSLRQRRRTAASEAPASEPEVSPAAGPATSGSNGKDPIGPPSLLPLLWRALALLAFIATTQIAGLVLFTQGLFPTRTELSGISRCSQPSVPPAAGIEASLSALVAQGQATPANWSSVLAAHGECTLPARFNRSLLFIVDALRYDLVLPPQPASEHAGNTKLGAVPSWLAGDVPAVQDLQAAHPGHSLLTRFSVDPSTPGLQRLKALTTGVPPVFINPGPHFGPAEVGEDNILSQLRVHSQARTNGTDTASTAFMGDDSWLSLFPNSFDKAWTWPYGPSRTEDLDTVDQGVQSHLRALFDSASDHTPESGNWSLIVAHQSGLDHALRHYGPDSPEVSRKLNELDGQLRFIADHLPDDALLILMGGHGKDAKAEQDEGGQLEAAAAFFAYAKRPLTAQLSEKDTLRYTALPKEDAKFSFGSLEGGHHFGSGQFVATATNLTAVGDDYLAFLACSEGYTCIIKATEAGAYFSGKADDSYTFSVPRNDLVSDEDSPPIDAASDGSVRTAPETSDEYVALHSPRLDTAHPSIQQIDYVPTFALLQGLPIPFNSLGTVIPGLFGDNLLRALRINALQIKTYLDRYMGQAGEFNGFVREFQAAWARAARADWARAALPESSPLQGPLTRSAEQAYFAYTRLALARAKQVWARFDFEAMGAGLFLVVLGMLSALRLRSSIGAKARPVAGLRAATNILGYAAGMGFVVSGPAIAVVLGVMGLWNEVSVLELVPAVRTRSVLGFIFCIQLALANLILLGNPAKTIRALIPGRGALLPAAIVLVHALSLASKSFVAWEGYVTFTLLQVLFLLSVAAGARMRFASLFSKAAGENAAAQRDLLRTGALAVLGIALSRFLITIRVCRDEQMPYCTTTFYARLIPSTSTGDSSGMMSPDAVAAAALQSSTNSLWASALALGTAYWLVPAVVHLAAGLTESDTRLVQLYVKWLLRSILVAGAFYWALDTLAAGATGLRPPKWEVWADYWKRPLALLEYVAVLVSIFVVWPASPLPLELRMGRVPLQPGVQRPVLTGLRNLMGIHFLLLMLFLASFVFLLAQPMGQVALGLLIAVVLCLAEVSAGGVQSLRERGTLETVSPLVLATLHLLSHVAFFSTGHQASASSIQWRAAFVGFHQLTYPFAHASVAVNSLGPGTVIVLAVPLLVLWRHAPRIRGTAKEPEEPDEPMATLPYLTRAALGYMATASVTTVAAAAWAGALRYHLMLSKVWAPRYMLAALALASTHLFLLLGVAAAGMVCLSVSKVLGTPFEARQYAEFETEEE